MKRTIQFTIYFEDLTKIAQHYLCKTFKTTPEEEHRSSFSLTTIEREQEQKEKKN